MGESTFARHVVEACRVIVQEFFAEAVKLPYGDELADCLRAAEQHDPPLPGAALFVDGTHIPYTPPAAIFMDYMNYKKFTSIQAQVVCDYREKVRDLVVGWSGKNNDGMVASNTFNKQLSSTQHHTPTHAHLPRLLQANFPLDHASPLPDVPDPFEPQVHQGKALLVREEQPPRDLGVWGTPPCL